MKNLRTMKAMTNTNLRFAPSLAHPPMTNEQCAMNNVQSGLGIGHWALGIGHYARVAPSKLSKIQRALGLLTLLAVLGVSTAQSATFTPRTDVNPAVLYWQSFSLYPELTDDIRRDFLSTPPKLSPEEAEPVLRKFD